jgi:hypothetical protein
MDLNKSISEGRGPDGTEEDEDDSKPSVLISDIVKREREKWETEGGRREEGDRKKREEVVPSQ